MYALKEAPPQHGISTRDKFLELAGALANSGVNIDFTKVVAEAEKIHAIHGSKSMPSSVPTKKPEYFLPVIFYCACKRCNIDVTMDAICKAAGLKEPTLFSKAFQSVARKAKLEITPEIPMTFVNDLARKFSLTENTINKALGYIKESECRGYTKNGNIYHITASAVYISTHVSMVEIMLAIDPRIRTQGLSFKDISELERLMPKRGDFAEYTNMNEVGGLRMELRTMASQITLDPLIIRIFHALKRSTMNVYIGID